jgi:hypothetical protein
LRFSVGLEDVGDLIADIEQSLPAAPFRSLPHGNTLS